MGHLWIFAGRNGREAPGWARSDVQGTNASRHIYHWPDGTGLHGGHDVVGDPFVNTPHAPAGRDSRMGSLSQYLEPVLDPQIRLGSLALTFGLVTPAQLQEALSIQAQEASSGKLARQLGLILLSKGFLDELQLVMLVRKQQELRGH